MTGGRWHTCTLCTASYRPADGHHTCAEAPRATPAAVYVTEVRAARQAATWRLLWRERRLARRHGLNPRDLARWAAVRSVLRERAVDLPDA